MKERFCTCCKSWVDKEVYCREMLACWYCVVKMAERYPKAECELEEEEE